MEGAESRERAWRHFPHSYGPQMTDCMACSLVAEIREGKRTFAIWRCDRSNTVRGWGGTRTDNYGTYSRMGSSGSPKILGVFDTLTGVRFGRPSLIRGTNRGEGGGNRSIQMSPVRRRDEQELSFSKGSPHARPLSQGNVTNVSLDEIGYHEIKFH